MVADLLADPYAPELEWPHLRRAVLGGGGIGPSADWPRDWYPGDLYREHGPTPDEVAASCYVTSVGGSGVIPWGEGGDDAAMFAYLRAAYEEWRQAPASARYSLEQTPRQRQAREQAKEARKTTAAAAATATPAAAPARGVRVFADLVAELKRKHGADVDLSGLRSEYVRAYETGERVTVEREGRTYRGTIGATRGPRPRFVLLLSMDL